MAELSIEEYKKLAEEFLEKYNKLDYIASGQRATDELNKTDPMRVNPGLEEVFGNPDAELAQEELIKEYQNKGLDASRVAYLKDTTPPDTLNTEAFNKAEQAYEDKMADIAAREPSEAELNRYIDSLNTADDAQIEAYNEMMLQQEIETKNNLPKGSISKLGAVLDPISEGLEVGLRAIGLGSIATWWVKAEAANFLAGILRAGEGGLAQAQLGQSAALMGEKDIASQTEENILKTAGNIFAQNMKLSPSMWFETKYAESKLGKGKTPTEQLYNKFKEKGMNSIEATKSLYEEAGVTPVEAMAIALKKLGK
jgi:hypothetical protein